MNDQQISVAAGGVLFVNHKVLLVKINYGLLNGHWMLPGGLVESGESLEDAVVREVKEESQIVSSPKRIIGLRSGVKDIPNQPQTGIYIVFELEYISGDPLADNQEISEAAFWEVESALEHPSVIDLTKEMIRSSFKAGGLHSLQDEIETQNKYLSYQRYTIK
ncbi:MAG: hydrolase [Bacilli bacterium]|nr:hydrolase [Bacilli bacterium]